MLKNIATLKSMSGVKQSHWKWYQSHMASYYRSIATMSLSRAVSEIDGDFSRKSQNFPIPCILRPRWRGSLGIGYQRRGSKTRMMGLPGRQRSMMISSAVWNLDNTPVTHIYRVVQKKTAQTLMHYNFSTAGHRVTRFPAKSSETNW